MQRLLHITDPHLFVDPSGELRGTNTYASFRNVLDHYEAADWRADAVALTGDLVQDDGPRAYDHFPRLLEKLGLPVVCIPGNHDDRDAMQEKLSRPPFLYCGTLRAGKWEILGIDSCLDGQAGGRIAEAELDRLSTLLASSGADHVCVCLHHPPVEVHSRWLDSVGLENRDAFLERLEAAGNVRLVLFGHVHQAIDVRAGRLSIVGTPSTCRQFMPHADQFAVDDKPPAYRRVELNDDGTARSELVWID